MDATVFVPKKIDLTITGITLLSIEEYEATKDNIPLVKDWWWLRSPGRHSTYAANVTFYGSVSLSGSNVVLENYGVRPALQISNLKSFDLKNGDKISLANRMWTVISDDLALSNEFIGMNCFRKNHNTPDANDYHHSDVKKYIEKWAKRNGIIE